MHCRQSNTEVYSPQIRYAVSEPRDCAGSCHACTDGTFTTIRTTGSGQHRSTAGSF